MVVSVWICLMNSHHSIKPIISKNMVPFPIIMASCFLADFFLQRPLSLYLIRIRLMIQADID